MAEEEPEYIPAKWIEIYHYCPRIIYYMAVSGARERETAYMREGKMEEENEEEKEKRRKTLLAKRKEKVLEKWTNLKLYSQKLGIVGVIDLLVKTEDRQLKVIDIKNTGHKRLTPGYLYQTAAYALLAQEHFKKPVKYIIVYYTKSDKIFEIKITDAIREHTLWTINKIKEIIVKEKLPRTKRSKECYGCGYFRFCKRL
ncbi:MAG: CRISPR-associated protein Cas4 [Nitrososphaeria archaeon]